MSGVSWLGAIRFASVALMGVPLTYAAYYGTRLTDRALHTQQLPNAILLALSVVLGGLLALTIHRPGRFTPWAAHLAAFIVFGHVVYGVAATRVSAAFVLSNWAVMLLSLFLLHAADEVADAEPRAAQPH